MSSNAAVLAVTNQPPGVLLTMPSAAPALPASSGLVYYRTVEGTIADVV
jgi:hypothetical protein